MATDARHIGHSCSDFVTHEPQFHKAGHKRLSCILMHYYADFAEILRSDISRRLVCHHHCRRWPPPGCTSSCRTFTADITVILTAPNMCTRWCGYWFLCVHKTSSFGNNSILPDDRERKLTRVCNVWKHTIVHHFIYNTSSVIHIVSRCLNTTRELILSVLRSPPLRTLHFGHISSLMLAWCKEGTVSQVLSYWSVV